MKQQMVTTNIRLPVADWLEVKAAAAEMGMSVNEYLNFSARAVTTSRQLYSPKKTGKNKYKEIWRIIHEKTEDTPLGLSDEDEAIYAL